MIFVQGEFVVLQDNPSLVPNMKQTTHVQPSTKSLVHTVVIVVRVLVVTCLQLNTNHWNFPRLFLCQFNLFVFRLTATYLIEQTSTTMSCHTLFVVGFNIHFRKSFHLCTVIFIEVMCNVC